MLPLRDGRMSPVCPDPFFKTRSSSGGKTTVKTDKEELLDEAVVDEGFDETALVKSAFEDITDVFKSTGVDEMPEGVDWGAPSDPACPFDVTLAEFDLKEKF